VTVTTTLPREATSLLHLTWDPSQHSVRTMQHDPNH
jgi:hypothetical protein